MKNLLLFVFVAGLLFSCTITQHYSFNVDYSGDYTLDFDITQLAEFGAESPDSVEDFFEEMNLDSLADAYNTVPGIANVRVTKDKNILHVAYSFANLEALNASLNTNGKTDLNLGDAEEKFKVTDGIFNYNIGSFGENPSDSLAEMMSFVDYDITMSFARKIKSASTGTISEDGKTVNLKGNFGEIVKEEKTLELEVIFNQFEDDVNERK